MVHRLPVSEGHDEPRKLWLYQTGQIGDAASKAISLPECLERTSQAITPKSFRDHCTLWAHVHVA